MKVIIAGSRTICDYSEVETAVRMSGFTVTEVVSGMARGADRLGAEWADNHGVPVKKFFAQWLTKDGEKDLGAGMARNRKMADYADALVAVWDGESTGTAHMIDVMSRKGKAVFIYRIDEL